MEGNSPYITNLVNSIIGVSVLAMPFCMKQCGIILGLGLLLSAAWLTYLSCSMLASSAYQKRRRSYEYLALFTLGPTGKFAVELSMIGLMLGTCIAFYVVIGDLSYGTIAKFVPGADPSTLRMYTIIFTALCIALPLGNMKNLSVLSYFGFVSLLFYSAFLVVVILNAVSNGLLNWEWLHKVNWWRPAGIFQCLPIFSLAYACQCQLFIVYSSLEEPTVHRVEDIVFGAIRFVTVAYMSIGFFGYTTYHEAIAGNLLLNFPSNALLDFIKMGFAMSVVLGFPLMISPCRQSIHTLIFAQPAGEGMQTTTYIPPFLFKSITVGIVTLTMFIAIVIPNVETILGLTGATMGSMICFIFPALIYEKAHSSKASTNTPKFVFVLGCILLVVCTYSNISKITNPTPVESPPKIPDIPDINLEPVKVEGNDVVVKEAPKDLGKELVPNDKEELEKPKAVAEAEGQDHRHEPPNPIEPDNSDVLGEEDAVVDIAKGVDEKKPDTNGGETKQESQKEEIHVNAGAIPKDGAESPVKHEEVDKKEEPAAVVKPNSPVQEIAPPAKQVEESKGEDINKNNGVVQEPKQPAPPQPNNDTPINKEVPKNPVTLSPKIIKRDDNMPAVDSHAKSDGGAQPGIQQGSPLKEQPVENVENPQKGAPVADSANEKELLEKIKVQHDMQQQLLIEQEHLIKKLEEHQDKKEQEKKTDKLVEMNKMPSKELHLKTTKK